MLLLAVDTSGKHGGLTLASDSRGAFQILESAPIQGGTFSAELIPQITEILRRQNLTAADLTGLVAVTGPGSFTGLRVGLTAVKGLAEVLNIPISAVSSLEVLLAAAQDQNGIIGLLDAGRGEVYAAIQKEKEHIEMLLNANEASDLARRDKLRVVVSDGVLAGKFPGAQLVSYQSSEVAAALGARKLCAGDTVDVLALDANYIRKSETEYLQKVKKG
jgi:tRNA threonylcarbamoyladenosine biosynthesis protein TsaB